MVVEFLIRPNDVVENRGRGGGEGGREGGKGGGSFCLRKVGC